MTCRRSAILMLIACMLLGAPSHGSQVAGYPANRVYSLITGHVGASMVPPSSHQPARGATLSQFSPWKTRLKTVLEETKQRIIEERDLGLAIQSGHLFSSATVDLVCCPLPTRPPLRC
jgi:hypothetical protein